MQYYVKTSLFYRQELASLFQVQEKLKTWINSKRNVSSSCFITDDSHLKIVPPNVAVFTEDGLLYFSDNYYPEKVTQNCFDSFNCSNDNQHVFQKSATFNKHHSLIWK